MSLERIRHLIGSFREQITAYAPGAPVELPFGPDLGRELLESMLLARHLDRAAHELRAAGHGHYTICSTGHEANVVLGRLTEPGDPAVVHYRSAALQLERARQVPGVDSVRDIALSLVASSEEPTSGGRHKVFGGRHLGMIPATSTIASHLPRAVGLAFALERRPRLGLEAAAPKDAIALASFGDASLNHSTAQGALNAAGWVAHQRLTLPLLFVCEDNGLGISVRTPRGWVEERLRALPHVEYFHAEGWDLGETYRVAEQAVQHCRRTRRPAVLHLECVRLLGHAGSDVDTVYRTPREIEEAESRDPVLAAAKQLIDAGLLDPLEVIAMEQKAAERVSAAAEIATGSARLETRAQVEAALARPMNDVEQEATRDLRALPSGSLTLAQGINAVLVEAVDRYPEAIVFGEDVAKKGGVYGLTKGLVGHAGPARVFNTLLDEQTILGLALGTATLGLLPIPEIQYLAYLHNAEDQLRGEAATMQFFSGGAYDNPMLLRIAGFAYQKGFGGHFHNDNSIAALRDIPGVVIGVPARADDAVGMYRSALAAAKHARRVVVMVEPIALYHSRDLHEDGDQAWTAPAPTNAAEVGRARIYREGGRDLVIASYGNGVWMSLRAAQRLERVHGVRARVLDLRWLAPLPIEDLLSHAEETGRLLFVDECRRTGSVSEAVAAALLDAGSPARFSRVTAADCYIPLGEAANLVLVSEDDIVESATELVR